MENNLVCGESFSITDASLEVYIDSSMAIFISTVLDTLKIGNIH